MDSNRRKQLKEAYKNSKTPMGVYEIRNTKTGKRYIGITQNLTGTMNGNLFKLDCGAFKDRELQEEWKTYGKNDFEQTILTELDYEEDETKTDYTEDLMVLRELSTEDFEYKKFI
jgi:hypothetical protein